MIREETAQLLNGNEGTDVEFKLTPKSVESEDLVAFANSQGGTILVGIDPKNKTIVGCSGNEDAITVQLMNKATDCSPSVGIEVTIENKSDRPIYRIDIPEGNNKPYSTAKGLYKIRVDGRLRPLLPPELRVLMLQVMEDEYSKLLSMIGDRELVPGDVLETFLDMPDLAHDLVGIKHTNDQAYIALMKNGVRTRKQLRGLAQSAEVLQVLRSLYCEELDRDPNAPLDPMAVATWGAILYIWHVSESTVSFVRNALQNSDEYRQKHFGT